MVTSTYVPLATVTLTSTDSEVVFGSIPATYRDLILVLAGTAAGNTQIRLRFNNDSGANYPSTVRMFGASGNFVGSTNVSNSGSLYVGQMGTLQAANVIQIMDYSATDKHKTVINRTNYTTDGTTSGFSTEANSGRWESTAAINQVTVFSSTWQVGTRFSLYGVN